MVESYPQAARVLCRFRLIAVAAVAAVACSESPTGPSGSPAPASSRRLSVGELTACALDPNGKVYCWGLNSGSYEEFGAPVTTLPGGSTPMAVPMPALASISGGNAQHMCGILRGGSAVCWGRNSFGELGGGVAVSLGNPPIAVEGVTAWSDIYVSRLNTCGVTPSGAGYCWGINQDGEVGVASVAITDVVSVPTTPVDGGLTFTTIVAGWLHSCGITTLGVVYCWGGNANGQLGIGAVDSTLHRTPTAISSVDRFIQLSLGATQTCGITTDHRAMCWGENGTGQLGDGTRTVRASPTPVAGGLKFVAIATASGFAGAMTATAPSTVTGGNAHSCALTEDGAAYCWGWNGSGQLGDGTTTDRLTPVAVSGNVTLTSIALGGVHSCGMRGNAVWCWGSNRNGQLGNGGTADSSVPVQVLAPFAAP